MSAPKQWLRAGPAICRMCGKILATCHGLIGHLNVQHPELGRRGRSLEMDRIRRSLGWPAGSDFAGVRPRGYAS